MIQDDYRDEEHDVDDDTDERRHTKEHYTWLVETLLNGLKEHASFEEKYPDIAAPVEMQTIRDEMERALLEGCGSCTVQNKLSSSTRWLRNLSQRWPPI